jgi:drug/metabolite transporter (DMT)-like permease
MGVVFVLPLGYWLTAQKITWKQVVEACLVVIGLSVFIVFGDPGGGRSNAPNWEWVLAIAVIAGICATLLPLGKKEKPSLRAGAYGAVSGLLSGFAATVCKPAVELLHTGGVGGS